ncbi:winged helix-turn-helix transcriptional regulator [Haloferacaceae archaeon DSL9]
MTERRIDVAEHVHRNPGIHFNGLVRDLQMAPNSIQTHVTELRRQGTIESEELFGRTHFYPPKYTHWERHALAMFRRETARGILFYLLENGPSRPNDVTDDLGVARSTLEWHLDNLIEVDLVEKQREQNHVTLVLCHPDETEDLLVDIKPLVPDRLLDRATHLLDRLLEGR